MKFSPKNTALLMLLRINSNHPTLCHQHPNPSATLGECIASAPNPFEQRNPVYAGASPSRNPKITSSNSALRASRATKVFGENQTHAGPIHSAELKVAAAARSLHWDRRAAPAARKFGRACKFAEPWPSASLLYAREGVSSGS